MTLKAKCGIGSKTNTNNTTANAIKAFDYAVKNGANILSNSWGANTYEPAMAAATRAASDAGVSVVVASGNENWDTGIHGSYPDNYAGSFSVAASDARESSSVVTTIATLPSSWPPYLSGIERPK